MPEHVVFESPDALQKMDRIGDKLPFPSVDTQCH